MLSLKMNNTKLEQDFMEIVRTYYENNFDLALSEAIEKFILLKKPANRIKMIELVQQFREKYKGTKNKGKIIEKVLKDYRLKHERQIEACD